MTLLQKLWLALGFVFWYAVAIVILFAVVVFAGPYSLPEVYTDDQVRSDQLNRQSNYIEYALNDLSSVGQVFCAVDSVGGQTFTILESVPVRLDIELVKQQIYTHQINAAAVCVKSSGLYRLHYNCGVTTATATYTIPFYAVIQHFIGARWQQVYGSVASSQCVGTASNLASVSAEVIKNINKNDSIRVIVFNASILDDLKSLSGTTALTIEQIY